MVEKQSSRSEHTPIRYNLLCSQTLGNINLRSGRHPLYNLNILVHQGGTRQESNWSNFRIKKSNCQVGVDNPVDMRVG